MNFLGMGPMELMLILVLALIIFGPGKLPEIAGQVGRVVRDFRRTTSELSSEFNRTLSLEIEEKKARTSQPAGTAVVDPAAVPVEPAPPPVAQAIPDPLDYRIEPTEAPLSVTSSGSAEPAPAAAPPAEPPPAKDAAVAGRRRTYDADLAPPY